MNQYGLGISSDVAQAVAWYRMAADQGNKTGLENVKTLSKDLQTTDPELWKAISAAAHEAGETQAARREHIAKLQQEITDLELDARQEDGLAEQVSGPVNGIGTIGPVRLRKEADQYRTQAARLRAELAGLDTLTAASVQPQ